MSDYEEVAPNVSQMVSETVFKSNFAEPLPPPPPIPEPDADLKMALLIAYRDEYNSNGGAVALGPLARRMGVPYNWAVICDREVRAAIVAVYAESE